MTSSLEQQKERVRTLLTEMISLFCKNTLMFDTELCIEGLIGITKDKTDLMLISIKDIISSTVLPCHNVADVTSCDEYVDRRSNSQDCRVDDSKGSVIVVKVEHTNPVEVISIDDSYSGDVSVLRHQSRDRKRHVDRRHLVGYTGDAKKHCVGGRNGDVAVTCKEPIELRNTMTNVQSDLSDFHTGFPYASPLHPESPGLLGPTSGGVDSYRSTELTPQRPGTETKFDTPLCDASAKFQCEICLRGFGVRQALEDHMQGVHLGTPRFLCPHCGKGFRFRSSLSYHKRKCLGNSQHAKSDPKLGWIYVSSSNQMVPPVSSIQSEGTVTLPSNDPSQLPVFPTADVIQQRYGKGFSIRSSLSYDKRKYLGNSQHAKSDKELGWIDDSSNDHMATSGSSIQNEASVASPDNGPSQPPVFPTADVIQQQLQEQLGHMEQESLLQQLCNTAAEQHCQEGERNGAAADASTEIADGT